jgi:hypothetical protein
MAKLAKQYHEYTYVDINADSPNQDCTKCTEPASDLIVYSSLITGNTQVNLISLPDAQVCSTLHSFHSNARQSTKGHEYYDQNIIKSKLCMQHGIQIRATCTKDTEEQHILYPANYHIFCELMFMRPWWTINL